MYSMFFDPFMCFSPHLDVWRGGGAGAMGLAHNRLMQFSTIYSSEMEISETDFFCILAIHNDQISDVKHILNSHCVFFTPFGCLEGARGWGTTCLCSFPPSAVLKWKFRKLLFLHSGHSQ